MLALVTENVRVTWGVRAGMLALATQIWGPQLGVWAETMEVLLTLFCEGNWHKESHRQPRCPQANQQTKRSVCKRILSRVDGVVTAVSPADLGISRGFRGAPCCPRVAVDPRRLGLRRMDVRANGPTGQSLTRRIRPSPSEARFTSDALQFDAVFKLNVLTQCSLICKGNDAILFHTQSAGQKRPVP